MPKEDQKDRIPGLPDDTRPNPFDFPRSTPPPPDGPEPYSSPTPGTGPKVEPHSTPVDPAPY